MARLACLTAALLAVAPMAGAAEWSCLEPALKAELQRKHAFEEHIAQLAVDARPEFAEVATLTGEAQKARLSVHHSMIVWLWHADPGRLSVPQAFSSVALPHDDITAWLQTDPEHREVFDLARRLMNSVRGHPQTATYQTHIAEGPLIDLGIAFSDAGLGYSEAVAACF